MTYEDIKHHLIIIINVPLDVSWFRLSFKLTDSALSWFCLSFKLTDSAVFGQAATTAVSKLDTVSNARRP